MNQETKTQPSKASVRFAKMLREKMLIDMGGLISPDPRDYEKAISEIAKAMDCETGLPELLSAAKEVVICSDEEDYEDIVVLKDAIRKVEGGKP